MYQLFRQYLFLFLVILIPAGCRSQVAPSVPTVTFAVDRTAELTVTREHQPSPSSTIPPATETRMVATDTPSPTATITPTPVPWMRIAPGIESRHMPVLLPNE